MSAENAATCPRECSEHHTFQSPCLLAIPTTNEKGSIMRRLLIRLSTRRCRGCADTSFHTGHLTWLGRRRYT